jgi:hypothetical protein
MAGPGDLVLLRQVSIQNAPVRSVAPFTGALPSLFDEEASNSTTATSFNSHRLSILGFIPDFCVGSLLYNQGPSARSALKL